MRKFLISYFIAMFISCIGLGCGGATATYNKNPSEAELKEMNDKMAMDTKAMQGQLAPDPRKLDPKKKGADKK